MERVLAQGDKRPMSGNREAMDDLKNILESRAQFYSKADLTFDTSDIAQEAAFIGLTEQLRGKALAGARTGG
jgi:XRE family aerobic/anaerobic benzoate catabolism transcriptional regulator